MKKYFKIGRDLLICSLFFAMMLIPVQAAIPSTYWKYQEKFAKAVESGNTSEAIQLGTEIRKSFSNQTMDKDKAGILYSTYDKLIPIYEKLRDYDMVVACSKAQIPYGEFLGFNDGVKLSRARIRKSDTMTEVYALTEGKTPYFGMKYEPKSGVYQGRVFSTTGTPPQEKETAVSFYVECIQEPISSYDSYIRPYADGSKLIHIAYNMPNENASLQQVLQSTSDEQIKQDMKYLSNLGVPVLLRIGGEMNVWQNLADPQTYKQAYQKIATIARENAPNVALVFSPNSISNWNTDISEYYPGDHLVDWVGVSLYTDQYRNAQTLTTGKDFEEMYYGNGKYANPLTTLRDITERYGSKKPIFITECGISHSSPNQNGKLTGFAQNRMNFLYTYVTMLFPQVKGIIYFDVSLQNGKYDYSLQKNSALYQTYQKVVDLNPTFPLQVNKCYEKAGRYESNAEILSLASYCGVPQKIENTGDGKVNVTYTLDGKKLSSQGSIPYQCEIVKSDVSIGCHELKVQFSGQGYKKTKNYILEKAVGGKMKLVEK